MTSPTELPYTQQGSSIERVASTQALPFMEATGKEKERANSSTEALPSTEQVSSTEAIGKGKERATSVSSEEDSSSTDANMAMGKELSKKEGQGNT